MVQYFVIYLSLLSTMAFAAEQPQEVFLDFSYPKVGYVVNRFKQKNKNCKYWIGDVIEEILTHKDQRISLSFSEQEILSDEGLETLVKAREEHDIKLNILDLSKTGMERDDFSILEKLSSFASYIDVGHTTLRCLNEYYHVPEEELAKIKNLVFIEEEKLQSRWASAKIHDRVDELPLLKRHEEYYALKKALTTPSFSQNQTEVEEEKSVTQEEKTFQKEINTFHQSPNKNSFGSSTRSNSSDGDKK